MRRYLSVDCGGTKTAFLLCDETGRMEAVCTLGPANYLVNGIDEVISVLKKGMELVCAHAHVEQKEITAAFFAVAGFKDIPDDVPWITERIEKAFPQMKIVLGNDTENALAGSLLGKSGIHIVAGTGSIGLGCDEDRQYIRSGGWHHLFGGDEGSAYWIGCQLILHFTRQADGREEKSELYSYLIDKYELGCPENILDLVIHRWKGERDKIAALSRDVYELAEMEDSNAIAVFDHAGLELGSIIQSIYDRGRFERPLHISYSGGVFKAMKYLQSSMNEFLVGIPHVFTRPQLPPIGGGILLACEAAGQTADEKLIENLRAAQRMI